MVFQDCMSALALSHHYLGPTSYLTRDPKNYLKRSLESIRESIYSTSSDLLALLWHRGILSRENLIDCDPGRLLRLSPDKDQLWCSKIRANLNFS